MPSLTAWRWIELAKRTQRQGAAARFGPRYGVSVRQRASATIARLSRKYTCPVCQYRRVRRQAAGIWGCKKCGHTFAGGVWEPYTRATDANTRIMQRATEGSSETDMAVIAQRAALEYERSLAEAADDDSEEE